MTSDTDSFQARASVPVTHSVTHSLVRDPGSIDRYLSLPMCTFTSLLEVLFRYRLWYSNLIWLLRHIGYVILRKPLIIRPGNKETSKGPLSPPTPAFAALGTESPMLVCHSYLRTSIEWLSATVVVRPRQLIQRLSASFVFLSTTFSGKTAPFISPSRNKTSASAMLASVDKRSRTPHESHNAARASGCFDAWRHHARGLLTIFFIFPGLWCILSS